MVYRSWKRKTVSNCGGIDSISTSTSTSASFGISDRGSAWYAGPGVRMRIRACISFRNSVSSNIGIRISSSISISISYLHLGLSQVPLLCLLEALSVLVLVSVLSLVPVLL